MPNLRDLMRKRLLDDMVKATKPEAGKWKLVLVDSKTIKILNSTCKMHEILEENVTLVEDVARKRSPHSAMEAIYFLTPDPYSVRKLIEDYSGKQVMYAAAHVFFSSVLPEEMFQRIKKSPALEYIRTLKEMNVDFIAMESQVYSLDNPLSLHSIFNPSRESTQLVEFQSIAKKLVSVCATLGELPYVRYYDPDGSRTSAAYNLAVCIKQEMDEYCRMDPDFPPASDLKRAILIITDRTMDMMAPLLHEFTYQAMMADLLEMDGNKYTYKNENDIQTSSVILDETDLIWTLIRHWHFADAVKYIRQNFNQFLNENKAASSAIGGGEKNLGLNNLKDIKDTVSALPQFQEMKAKFSVHINISQECKLIFGKKKLDAIAAVEQDLAMGETSDGRQPKNMVVELAPILSDNSITAYDKLRLLMLYIISSEGIQDNERRRLLEQSALSLDDSQALVNLAALNVKLSSTSAKRPTRYSGRYAYFGSQKADKNAKKGSAVDASVYDLSRYIPIVKQVIKDQINNCLDKAVFPWLVEPPQSEVSVPATPSVKTFTKGTLVPPDPKYPNSLRTTRSPWAKTSQQGNEKAKKAQLNAQTDEDFRRAGARVIVFCAGGIAYSEVRAAYEAMKESGREVIIGSSFIYNPNQFVEIMKEIHRPDVFATNLPGYFKVNAEPVEESKEVIKEKRKTKTIFG